MLDLDAIKARLEGAKTWGEGTYTFIAHADKDVSALIAEVEFQRDQARYWRSHYAEMQHKLIEAEKQIRVKGQQSE